MINVTESVRRDMTGDDERIVTDIETLIAIAVELETEIVTVIAHQHIALTVVFLPAAAIPSVKNLRLQRTRLLRHRSMKSH
jgi:hypothetical protein